MLADDLDFSDLEPELNRIGVTREMFTRMLRDFDTKNTGSQSLDEDFAVAIDIKGTLQLLKTLPDGAGQTSFVRLWEAKFIAPWLELAKRAAELERRRRRDLDGAADA